MEGGLPAVSIPAPLGLFQIKNVPREDLHSSSVGSQCSHGNRLLRWTSGGYLQGMHRSAFTKRRKYSLLKFRNPPLWALCCLKCCQKRLPSRSLQFGDSCTDAVMNATDIGLGGHHNHHQAEDRTWRLPSNLPVFRADCSNSIPWCGGLALCGTSLTGSAPGSCWKGCLEQREKQNAVHKAFGASLHTLPPTPIYTSWSKESARRAEKKSCVFSKI